MKNNVSTKKKNLNKTAEAENIKLVQKYKFNKYAIDDDVMNSPLTEHEKSLINKYF